MSGRDEMVSDELALLLKAEKPEPEVSREARDRMFSKLDAALVIAAAATVATTAHVVREAATAAATTATTAAVGAATQEAVVNTAASGAAGGGLSVIARLFATKVPFGVLMFALGGVSGVAVAPKIMKPTVVMVPAPVAAPVHAHPRASVAVPVPEPVVAPEPVIEPPVVEPPRPAPHAPPTLQGPVEHGVDQAVRSRLDRAGVAIRENHTSDAREALMELEAPRYRNEEVEERECLWVALLVKEGRGAEARARAERFRQRFPGSLFTARVDRDIAHLPAQ